MTRFFSAVALAALGLATISGCSITVDGEEKDSVTRQFGNDYVGIGGMVNLTDPVAGDAMLAGGYVATAGEVKGDLIAAGGQGALGPGDGLAGHRALWPKRDGHAGDGGQGLGFLGRREAGQGAEA